MRNGTLGTLVEERRISMDGRGAWARLSRWRGFGHIQSCGLCLRWLSPTQVGVLAADNREGSAMRHTRILLSKPSHVMLGTAAESSGWLEINQRSCLMETESFCFLI